MLDRLERLLDLLRIELLDPRTDCFCLLVDFGRAALIERRVLGVIGALRRAFGYIDRVLMHQLCSVLEASILLDASLIGFFCLLVAKLLLLAHVAIARRHTP